MNITYIYWAARAKQEIQARIKIAQKTFDFLNFWILLHVSWKLRSIQISTEADDKSITKFRSIYQFRLACNLIANNIE